MGQCAHCGNDRDLELTTDDVYFCPVCARRGPLFFETPAVGALATEHHPEAQRDFAAGVRGHLAAPQAQPRLGRIRILKPARRPDEGLHYPEK